ncbi:MAG: hypothetical protein K2J70_03985 [Muribaculaceae bacterium]|nr:hypothetical protein [Muribaculaceae bacterium]
MTKDSIHWFAIKTRNDFRAETILATHCQEVFLPKEKVKTKDRKTRVRAVIPRVLFIRTTQENALLLEEAGREHPEQYPSFWIYRYPHDRTIRIIPRESIDLLRLLTSGDTTRCQIFTKTDYKEGQRVRITGGPFQGYEGNITRVRKNRHVIVRIEGICMVMLPYIHPDLLEAIE